MNSTPKGMHIGYDSALWLASFFVMGFLSYKLFKKSTKKILRLGSMKILCPHNLDENLLLNFIPFKEWCLNILDLQSDGAIVESVEILHVYMFGPRIGFLYMDVRIFYMGKYIPGAVMLRGASCGVCIYYEDYEEQTKRTKVLLIQQPRVATGKLLWEIPAGMLDGEANVQGKIFEEIYEETGISVTDSKLVSVGLVPYTSPGLLDEKMHMFTLKMNSDDIASLKPNCTSDEVIKNIKWFDKKDLPLDDMKLLAYLGI